MRFLKNVVKVFWMWVSIAALCVECKELVARITFYQNPNYEGKSYSIPRLVTRSDCYSFSAKSDIIWSKRISSIDTGGQCVILFTDFECDGESTRISPSHPNLKQLGLNNRIKSFILCQENRKLFRSIDNGNTTQPN